MSAEDKVHLPDSLVMLMDGRRIGAVTRDQRDGTRLTFDYDPAWRGGGPPIRCLSPCR